MIQSPRTYSLYVLRLFLDLLVGIERHTIHGIQICRGAPGLSHFFFAYDTILFAKASVKKCSEVAKIIIIYERGSGQKVNYDKT